MIGYQAGAAATASNKLYIANSNTATPLIYGEFDTPVLKLGSVGGVDIVLAADNDAPADATLMNGAACFYLDESGHNLMVKVKYAAGTVKTGTVCAVA